MSANNNYNNGNRTVSSAEVEHLRASNTRLDNTVQELKLEIAYYKGETKRLEWEKNILNQDVQRMSTLFKTWIHDLNQNQASKSTAGNGQSSEEEQASSRVFGKDINQLNTMIRYPCKPISELLQIQGDEIVFATSSQPPHYIEYVNKSWCDQCGWQASEILGLTCSFLQGEMTDADKADSFMKDVKEVGYGVMRVYNYRKNGEVFEVNVTVYPVFDTICSVGPDADIAVLTHFASVMTDIKTLPPRHHNHNHNSNNNHNKDGSISSSEGHHHHKRGYSDGDTTSHSSSSSMLNVLPGGSSPQPTTDIVGDRRDYAKRYQPKFILSPENFLQFGETIRLSNLMRLMLSCCSAMVLTDVHGDVVHCNTEFSKLSGFEITDIQGMQCCDVMRGPRTHVEKLANLQQALSGNQAVEVQIIQHRKNQEAVLNRIIAVPIYGGYLRAEVTHYCLLYLLLQNLDNPHGAYSHLSASQPSSEEMKVIDVQQVCSPINSHFAASESNSSVSSMDNNSQHNGGSVRGGGSSNTSETCSNDGYDNSNSSNNNDTHEDPPQKRSRMDMQ